MAVENNTYYEIRKKHAEKYIEKYKKATGKDIPVSRIEGFLDGLDKGIEIKLNEIIIDYKNIVPPPEPPKIRIIREDGKKIK